MSLNEDNKTTTQTTVKKPKAAKRKDYVNNAALLAEFRKSKDPVTGEMKYTDEFIRLSMKMCERIATRKHFNDKADYCDCIQSAMHDILRYMWRFNENVTTNIFAYMTSVISCGFAKHMNQFYKFKKSEMISIDDDIHSL